MPFVAPPGIRWVRIDRASGKRVYGVFPNGEDPKAAVIWEAFQPQTEPRRSFRHRHGTEVDAAEAAAANAKRPRAPSLRPMYQTPAPVRQYQAPQPAPLQNTTAAL